MRRMGQVIITNIADRIAPRTARNDPDKRNTGARPDVGYRKRVGAGSGRRSGSMRTIPEWIEYGTAAMSVWLGLLASE